MVAWYIRTISKNRIKNIAQRAFFLWYSYAAMILSKIHMNCWRRKKMAAQRFEIYLLIYENSFGWKRPHVLACIVHTF